MSETSGHENGTEVMKETKLSRIEDVAKDAQKELAGLAEKLKSEKVDKNKYPPEKALEILKFTSELTDIPSVQEFLSRRGEIDNYYVSTTKFGIELVSPDLTDALDVLDMTRRGATVLADKRVIIDGKEYEPGELFEGVNQDWDNGNRPKKTISKIAKLNKIDVVKKLQKQIKV